MGVIGVVLIGLLSLPGDPFGHAAAAPSSPSPSHARPGPAPEIPTASSFNLQQDGLDPEAVGLRWSVSPAPCFENYTLTYSATGAAGPWATYGNFSDPSTNSTVAFEPIEDVTLWWRVVATTCLGDSTSNSVESTVPDEPTLSYRFPTSTSVTIAWANPAVYSDLIRFQSYELFTDYGGRRDGGPLITNYSEQSVTVDLYSLVLYEFQVSTHEACCDTSFPSWNFLSNRINLSAPSPVTAAASVSPAAVDVGQAAAMTCTATGGVPPYAHTWAFGDGGTGSGPSVAHSFTAAGKFLPVCSVHDATSATATAGTAGITVSPALVVSASVSRPAAYPGTVLTFQATVSGGSGSVVGYSWDFGDGSQDIGPTATHLFATPSSYLVRLTVVDSNGGSVGARTQVSVANLSATAIAQVSEGVPGQPLRSTATAGGGAGPPYGFAWSFGDGTGSVGPSVTHSYASAGTYTPTVVVTDSLGGDLSVTTGTITVTATSVPGGGARPELGLGPTVAGLPVLVLLTAAVVLLAAGGWLRLRRPPRRSRRSTPSP